MKRIVHLLNLTFYASFLFAQADLKPSIGIGDLPADAAPVCEIPLYLGDFESTGLQNGDTLYDFNLYSVDNQQFDMG